MKRIALLTCLLSLLFGPTMQAQNEPATQEPAMTEEQRQQYADIMNDFAFDLYRLLQPAKGSNEGVVCSPLSIYLMLGILANGADAATLEEISRLTGTDLATVNEYCGLLMSEYNEIKMPSVEIASFLAVNKKVKLRDAYQQLVSRYYSGQAQSMDFSSPESTQLINAWCNRMTHGMIPSVIERLTPDMIAVMLNAIYFKGTWQEQFDSHQTDSRDFHREDGTTAKRMMMRKTDKMLQFRYMENDTMQALQLPYEGGVRFYMTVLLPKEGHSTTSLMQKMTTDEWKQINKRMNYERVYITMPRFTAENNIDLIKTMKTMGMNSAFSAGADFTRMSKTQSYIGQMFQKARIDVNENGTEAAAVTVVAQPLGSARNAEQPKIYHFYADHPFVYAIVDARNGNVLFIGEYRG